MIYNLTENQSYDLKFLESYQASTSGKKVTFHQELSADDIIAIEAHFNEMTWAERKAYEEAKPTKMKGIEFQGVMCSATSEDMWGLAAVKPWILAGNSVNFNFSNGNNLVLTSANVASFEAVWIPFRASFF